MSAKYADGTVVQLKSGGPVMTIRHFDEDSNYYCCEWFVKDEIKQATFQEPSIEEYKPDETW